VSKKIVITCGESIVAQHLLATLETESFSLSVLTECDVDSEQAVAMALGREKPNLVVNTLPHGVADSLVTRSSLASRSAGLASVCAELGVPLLHLSSHEVFGGENKTHYSEQDVPAPINARGQAFWDAERNVQMASEKHIILRLSWVMSGSSDCVFTRLLQRLVANGEVQVSHLLRASPTFADDVARVIVGIIKQVFSGSSNWGIYHYASGDTCSEYQFAESLQQILVSLDVPAGLIVEADTPTESPSAVLACLACRDDFGVQQRSWRQRLEVRVKAWLDANGLNS